MIGSLPNGSVFEVFPNKEEKKPVDHFVVSEDFLNDVRNQTSTLIGKLRLLRKIYDLFTDGIDGYLQAGPGNSRKILVSEFLDYLPEDLLRDVCKKQG